MCLVLLRYRARDIALAVGEGSNDIPTRMIQDSADTEPDWSTVKEKKDLSHLYMAAMRKLRGHKQYEKLDDYKSDDKTIDIPVKTT